MEYKNKLSEKIFDLLSYQEFCDMQISAGDHCYYCHKLVLAAASPAFYNIIRQEVEKSQEKNILEIQLEFMSFSVIEALLQFFYTGERPTSEESWFVEYCHVEHLFTQKYISDDTLSEIKTLHLDFVSNKKSKAELLSEEFVNNDDEHDKSFITDNVCIIEIAGGTVKTSNRADCTRIKLRLPREPPFLCPCENCGKIFESHERLRSHYRHNHGEKKFKCNECPLRFLYPRDLRAHLRTHTGEKPYICEICGKGFSQKSAMTTHMKIHEKDTHHEVVVNPCLVCKNKYVSKDNNIRTIDIKDHDMSSLVCPNANCAKKFASVKSLQKHVRNDICNMKQLSCTECKTKFTTMQLLRQHIVRKHCTHTYKKKIKKAEDGSIIKSTTKEHPNHDLTGTVNVNSKEDHVLDNINLQEETKFLVDDFPAECTTGCSALEDFMESVELGSEIVMEIDEG